MRRQHKNKKKEPLNPDILFKLTKYLQDESDYHRTFTYSGDVRENYNGDCIFLNGGGSKNYAAAYIDIGRFPEIGTSDFSFSCDVNITQSSGYNYSIILGITGSNSTFGVQSIRFTSSGNSGWYANGIRIMDSVRSYNTWYHWEFRRLNGRYELLVDNTLVGYSTYSISNDYTSQSWRIGQNQSYAHVNNEHMTGYIKNIVIKLL